MVRVDVLYFDGCPNHEPTVELVRGVVADLGHVARRGQYDEQLKAPEQEVAQELLPQEGHSIVKEVPYAELVPPDGESVTYAPGDFVEGRVVRVDQSRPGHIEGPCKGPYHDSDSASENTREV